MSNNLIIAQVTDLHIAASDVSYRGIKVRQKFVDVLQVLAEKDLDLLVLSGDLAASEGEPEAYAWIRQTLATFPFPYLVMPGNHDQVIRMKRAFNLPDSEVSQGRLYFSRNIKGRQLMFLDSTAYRVTKQQLDWLTTQLANCNEPVLLFIHHPPLLCGCQFMDERYALQNIDDIWQVLDQFSNIKHIFCGHYHADKTLVKNGKYIYLTPSTAFQIDTESPDLIIDHTKHGWRMIELNDQQVHTYVKYL